MAPFASAAFPECLAIASDDALLIGTIDAVQKLTCARCRSASSRGVSPTSRERTPSRCSQPELTPAADGEGEDDEVAFVRLLDDQSFERLAELQLQPKEMCISVAYVARRRRLRCPRPRRRHRLHEVTTSPSRRAAASSSSTCTTARSS